MHFFLRTKTKKTNINSVYVLLLLYEFYIFFFFFLHDCMIFQWKLKEYIICNINQFLAVLLPPHAYTHEGVMLQRQHIGTCIFERIQFLFYVVSYYFIIFLKIFVYFFLQHEQKFNMTWKYKNNESFVLLYLQIIIVSHKISFEINWFKKENTQKQHSCYKKLPVLRYKIITSESYF